MVWQMSSWTWNVAVETVSTWDCWRKTFQVEEFGWRAFGSAASLLRRLFDRSEIRLASECFKFFFLSSFVRSRNWVFSVWAFPKIWDFRFHEMLYCILNFSNSPKCECSLCLNCTNSFSKRACFLLSFSLSLSQTRRFNANFTSQQLIVFYQI